MNSIALQGNILTFDILERIASDQEVNQAPKDYGFNNKSEILSQLETNWGNIKMLFGTYQKRLESLSDNDSGVSLTRKWWMNPFMSELGYEMELNKESQTINDRKYFVSHQDNQLNGFPIHIIGANQSLDKKYPMMRMSAHAMIQEYLNHHENLYAIVTNGHQLRLIRDSQLLTKVSYVEFDLHKMITEDQFSDFVLLWKLLHVTRMPDDPEKGPESIIEQYHLNSLESGSRIRKRLSNAVKHGITILANGLIQEPDNEGLRNWIAENEMDRSKEYYGELLRVIYRILFVMVIEERDLIYPSKLTDVQHKQKKIYYDYYSLRRLRQLAVKHYYSNDQHYDLWQYMLNVFDLYEGNKGKKLGIQSLAGDLFSSNAIAHISQCQLNNDILLQLFRGLTLFENEQGQFITVNYKSLDVEEFGSVYEGLLELDPTINISVKRFSFVQGDGRSFSGAHYTPDELVQPLIKHSLEHLIQDIIKEKIEDENKVQKLLKLTVCDVACGSGHILLAAARRIGLEVARLRTKEEQPNPEDARIGTRDAIQHCIYGVDKNPLAVELCKVALWLEAHVPGEPLNFLDHKIKNGDAIVGLARMDELYNGIASEAFKPYKDEEKENCRILKASNKKQRQAREGGQVRTRDAKEIIKTKLSSYKESFDHFAKLSENSTGEINAKSKAYKNLTSGVNWWFVKNLADLQVAQFFVEKSDISHVVTDDDYFDIMAGRKKQTNAETMALVESEKRIFFHWFLEFPEVFVEGGFSIILGNPPYLGGSKISSAYGSKYLNFLLSYKRAKGRADLISYFFKRIETILKPNNYFALLATDSISTGITREASLDYLIEEKGEFIFAMPSISWPGEANTFVSILSFYKGFNFPNKKQIRNLTVKFISPYLDDSEFWKPPHILTANDSKVFTGSKIYGEGFIVDYSFAEGRNFLKEYLTGDDITSNSFQKPKRIVIDVNKLTLEELKKYDSIYNHLKGTVFKSRQKLKQGTKAREEWWKYERQRKELYNKLNNTNFAFAFSQSSKYISLTKYSNEIIYSVKCIIVPSDNYNLFSNLESNFHKEWAWKFGTKMGPTTLQYGLQICFGSFPNTLIINEDFDLNAIGIHYFNKRAEILRTGLSLTAMNNLFHDKELDADSKKDLSDENISTVKKNLSKDSWVLYSHLQKLEDKFSFKETAEKVVELRLLHVEMDRAVLEAYGFHINSKRWGPAIDLRHDIYEVDYLPENDQIRYTIHPDARKEVLNRLLLLNHEIHESEKREISYEELDREKIMEIYKEEIGSWLDRPNQLNGKTLKFLSSGEDLLPTLDTSTAKSYKPFVSQYSSALENELQSKIFIPWNDKFQEKWKDDPDGKKVYLTEQIQTADKIKMMCGALKKNDDKYTLGNMHFFLNIIWNPKSKTVKNSSLMQYFKDHVYSVYSEEFVNKEVISELEAFIKNFRNEAAHTGEVDKQQAMKCMEEVRRFIILMTESEIIIKPKILNK